MPALVGTSAQEALEYLRRWESSKARAKEMGDYRPEPSIQHAVLDAMVR
jgi:hypothetical protein